MRVQEGASATALTRLLIFSVSHDLEGIQLRASAAGIQLRQTQVVDEHADSGPLQALIRYRIVGRLIESLASCIYSAPHINS